MSGQLERLLAQATPQPWFFDADDGACVYVENREWMAEHVVRGAIADTGYSESPGSHADARLIALAPDLARLLVDIVNDDGTTLRPSLLTRYLEIEQRAGEGQA